MRLARSWSVALVGFEATMVEVEVWFGSGLPGTVIVGLGDTAVQQARERCRAAVTASGFTWPATALTINLTPANLPKAGSHFDLAIVAAVLGASGVVPPTALESTVLMGEVGLGGRVRPVAGILPALLQAQRAGIARALVPLAQAREARLVGGLQVIGVEQIVDAATVLRGEPFIEAPLPAVHAEDAIGAKDLADVVGQPEAKWALEVAAAGSHHLVMTGPPGVGKTMLAERLPGLLPDLTDDEALEVSAIHSLIGGSLDALIRRPPYASPHHSASRAALVGGGSLVGRPGAASRAHRGVLFLDEAPEFAGQALEGLRTTLELGQVVLNRSYAQTTYPARFQLVLASNPCPCGWYNVSGHGDRCRCAPMSIRRYGDRLSGPILDRVDVRLGLQPLPKLYLTGSAQRGESTASVAARVVEARRRQARRLAGTGFSRNADVPGPVLRRCLPLPDGLEAVEEAVRRGQLSARGVDKVLRLAWTLADLAGHDQPTTADTRTALGMRRGEIREVSYA